MHEQLSTSLPLLSVACRMLHNLTYWLLSDPDSHLATAIWLPCNVSRMTQLSCDILIHEGLLCL